MIMKNLKVALVLLFFFVIVQNVNHVSSNPTQWANQGHDPQRSSASTTVGPFSNTSTVVQISLNTVLGTNIVLTGTNSGLIIFITQNYTLICITTTGRHVWSNNYSPPVNNLALNPNGVGYGYVTSSNALIAFNTLTGATVYEVALPQSGGGGGSSVVVFGEVVSVAWNTQLHHGAVLFIYNASNGAVLQTNHLPNWSGNQIWSNNFNLLFLGSNVTIYCYSVNSNYQLQQRWMTNGTYDTTYDWPYYNGNGGILIAVLGGAEGDIGAYASNNGNNIWNSSAHGISGLSLGLKNDLFFTQDLNTGQPRVTNVAVSNGNQNWNSGSVLPGSKITAPSTDGNGNVYFCSGSQISAFSDAGNYVVDFPLNQTCGSQLYFSTNGQIVLGNVGGILTATQ